MPVARFDRRHSATARRVLWQGFLVLGVAAVAVYFLLPDGALRVAYDLFGIAAVLAIATGIAIHRPAPMRPWLLVGVGIGVYLVGDLLYSLVLPADKPFPSLADACYLAGMLLLIAGASRIGAPEGRRRLDGAVLDAVLLATATGVVIGLLVVDPLIRGNGTADPLAVAVSLAYPVLDLIAIAVIAHRFLCGARRQPSSLLLVAGLAAFTIADVAYSSVTLTGSYAYGHPIDAAWLLGYVLMGAAALHPSMGRAPDPVPMPAAQLDRGRRLLMIAALLVAMVSLVGMPVRGPDDVFLALAGSILIVGIVVARLLGALSATDRRADEALRLRAELTAQSRVDPLTGLPNRQAFLEHLQALMADRGSWVLFLDLDGFKHINDGFGHAAGDQLLLTSAERLRSAVRDGDLVARLGGDEFAIGMASGADRGGAFALGWRIIDALDRPVEIDGAHITVGVSVGVAAGLRGSVATEVVRAADVAMYEAKSRGGRSVVGFEADTHTSVMRGYRLASDMVRGLERDEFALVFQPVVDLRSGRPAALEALLRWHHPEAGLLMPSEFIPLAERSALIDRLDDRALELACRQVTAWHAAASPLRDLPVHVNLSAHRLDSERARHVIDRIRSHELDPRAWVIEVTEGVLLERRDARAAMADLHDAGIRVALDDFGVRYAVLAELTELSFDLVKLDRSFLAPGDDARRFRLLSGIVALLGDLGTDVIIEGVETADDARIALEAGATVAQGYLFGRPVTAEALLRPDAPKLVLSPAAARLGLATTS